MDADLMLILVIFCPPIILYIALSIDADIEYKERNKYSDELFEKEIYEIYRAYAIKIKEKENETIQRTTNKN